MDYVVAFAHFIQHIFKENVARAGSKILLFFPMFSYLMVTIDDDIDKFIAAVHGTNFGPALAQSISIPVGLIIHLKTLRFELDDRNKWDELLDAEMLPYIDIAQLIVMRSIRNQDAKNTEIL